MVQVLVRPRFSRALAAVEASAAAGMDLDPPVSGAVYGAILNLRSQLEALGDAVNAAPYKAPPKAPVLYVKPPNTWRPDRAEVAIPAETDTLELGATLAVVIGRTATRVRESEALGHVLGFAVAIDVCIPHASLYRPALRQRCRDGFLPIGPWVMPRDQAPPPDRLEVAVAVNGEERRRFSTTELVRPVAQLIAEVTDFMTLFEGDALLVGLPADAAQARRGDRVEARIDGVGALSCTLVAEAGA